MCMFTYIHAYNYIFVESQLLKHYQHTMAQMHKL